MIDRIEIPIYNTDVALLIEITEQELSDFYEDNKEFLTQEEYENLKKDICDTQYEGLTLSTGSHKYLIYLRNGKSDITVPHEIFHVCNKILLDRGVSFDEDAEAWAYLIGWFTNEYYTKYWNWKDKKRII